MTLARMETQYGLRKEVELSSEPLMKERGSLPKNPRLFYEPRSDKTNTLHKGD